MALKKTICLTDDEGQIRWFSEEDLLEQLALADHSPTGAFKAAVRTFLGKAKNLRAEQKAYFAAKYGTPEKERHLRESKRLEADFDKSVFALSEIIDKI